MKIALILCSDMHMDIDRANTLMGNYPNHEWIMDCTDCAEADVVIIMTCAFGNKKAYSMFVIADALKNAKEGATVVATGCLVKLNRAELESIPGLTVKDFYELSSILGKSTLATQAPLTQVTTTRVTNRIPQNVVIISSGCLKKCSYCVYPLIEGKYKSKPLEDILCEISILAKTEPIVYITGAQETSDYGVDLYGMRKFACLLEQICEQFPKLLIGIGWFNPDGLTDEVLNVIEMHKNVIHIMLHMQHNNNNILKNMHRPCFEITESKIKKLHSVRPDIQISTEVIVGFPGETEEIFNGLVDYLEGARELFQDIGVASYEPVMGTTAATLPGLPEYSIRQKRMEIIQEKFNATAYPAPKEDFKPLLSSYIEALLNTLH